MEPDRLAPLERAALPVGGSQPHSRSDSSSSSSSSSSSVSRKTSLSFASSVRFLLILLYYCLQYKYYTVTQQTPWCSSRGYCREASHAQQKGSFRRKKRLSSKGDESFRSSTSSKVSPYACLLLSLSLLVFVNVVVCGCVHVSVSVSALLFVNHSDAAVG
jgi:hypothetical protein